jgi:hypothetical protein
MQPIDRPFRFSWDFCVVWALLAVPTFLVTKRVDLGPWYSHYGCIILTSLFSTFVFYGPVLLSRQIIHSGSHGRLILRVFVSILLAAVLLFVGLMASGFYSPGNARIVAFVFVVIATIYLHWRTDEADDSSKKQESCFPY